MCIRDRRETTNNYSWDTAKFEACGHKWADLSENSSGVSLLNDCKYGYSIKKGDMSLTLIKSGTYPNEDADIGEHRFTYSIYPHAGRWQEAKTVEMAYNLNVPMPVKRIGKQKGCGEEYDSFLHCDKESCFIAVSYTHLDVYKRQGMRHEDFNIKWKPKEGRKYSDCAP